MRKHFSSLISCARLREMIGKEEFHLIDTSSNDITIPGAKFMDLNCLKGPGGRIPSDEVFSAYMQEMGIPSDDTPIVVYDKQGAITSPRAWFMLKAFGRSNVQVLDGGFPQWISLKYPTEQTLPTYSKAGNFDYKLNKSMIREYQEVIAHQGDLIDCRKPDMYHAGHIPGAKNVFFMQMFNSDRTFKTGEQIQQIFEDGQVSYDSNQLAIHMCNIGMTACISILAMDISGKNNYALYDGSWLDYLEKSK